MTAYRKLSLPYLIWMIILVLLPLVVMSFLAFSNVANLSQIDKAFSIKHFQSVFTPGILKAFRLSLRLAFFATIGCFALGYPLAYILSKSKIVNKIVILLILILPMWCNMLLRVHTINKLLEANGFMKNVFGLSLGLSGTNFAVVLVMIIIYLPFMVFPVFTVLEKIDPSLLDASRDLGANDFKTFWKVTFPLSLKGVTSGVIMVFLPCAMGFTIPQIVNSDLYLIGNIIEMKVKSGAQYNVGSLLSLVIMIVVLGALAIIGKIDEDGETLI